jgi:NADH:ubiquinone oxidoreductase subunit 6 (subunit J)
MLFMDFMIYIVFYKLLPFCLYNSFLFLLVLIVTLCFLVLYFEDPIYSILTLTVVFLLTAFTLLLLKVEFLAYVYVLVYVGAVMLLFIFVVFMLGPVYTKSYRQESLAYLHLFITKFFVLFSYGVWDFVFFPGFDAYAHSGNEFWSKTIYSNDIIIFSNLLYTDHFFLLWVVAVILLVAMIAPIIFHFNNKRV